MGPGTGTGPGIAPGAALDAATPWLAPHAVQVGLPSGKLVPQVWQKLIVFSPYTSMAGGWRHVLLPWASSLHNAGGTVSLFVQSKGPQRGA